MTRFALTLVPLALLAAGCGDTSPDISASDELALTAVSGQEEDFAGAPTDFSSDDAPGRPDLFRACDADGSFRGLQSQYDVDGDGELSDEEQQAVFEDRGERDSRRWRARAARWAVLNYVYDTNMDGELGKSEHGQLHADFDARCEVLHERLLAEFDADGDGELSEDEQAAAREAIEAEREARREGCNECQAADGERPEDLDGRCEGGDREGMRPGMGEGERPAEFEGARPVGRPMGGEGVDVTERVLTHLTTAWDVDGDGELSQVEHDALFEAISARISSGEPMRPRGEPAEVTE